MRAPEYRFVDRWHAPAPIDRVYTILGDPARYPEWWGEVFLAADGDRGEPAPGKSTAVVSRGFMPYRLRWTMTCTAAERPRRIESRLSGDFEGTGTWLLEPAADGGTDASLDFRPSVRKRGVRDLSPLLRPVFRVNHAWAMRRGQAAILRLLASESQEVTAR